MSNPIVEEELQEAEKILAQLLVFAQYGAPAGISPKKMTDLLYKQVEHFLRRSEPESIYFERFGDKDFVEVMLEGQPAEGQFKFQQPMGIKTFPDDCVCGQWSESPTEVHMISAPCYYTEV